jgi:hypothetical protein
VWETIILDAPWARGPCPATSCMRTPIVLDRPTGSHRPLLVLLAEIVLSGPGASVGRTPDVYSHVLPTDARGGRSGRSLNGESRLLRRGFRDRSPRPCQATPPRTIPANTRVGTGRAGAVGAVAPLVRPDPPAAATRGRARDGPEQAMTGCTLGEPLRRAVVGLPVRAASVLAAGGGSRRAMRSPRWRPVRHVRSPPGGASLRPATWTAGGTHVARVPVSGSRIRSA